MAEEAAQAPEGTQDTPDESAPPGEDTREATAPETPDTAGTEQPETDVDWAKRYNDLRPEYDRTTAALKEAQHAAQVVQALQSDDPQERAWAADILGLELEDDEGDTPDDDAPRDPRVDALIQEREQEREAQQLEQMEREIDQEIDTLDKQNKTQLDDVEKELVWQRALALPPIETQDGIRPNVAQAFQDVTGVFDSRIKKYRESKRDAPTPPVPGQSGSTQVDPSTRKGRLERSLLVADQALQRGR